MSYDEKLCNERHENVKDAINDHEKRLNNHSGRLDKLEQDNEGHKKDITNLIKKMDDFINTIKWGLGIFVTVSLFVMGILLKK
jgi:chromosome segregation ATPase